MIENVGRQACARVWKVFNGHAPETIHQIKSTRPAPPRNSTWKTSTLQSRRYGPYLPRSFTRSHLSSIRLRSSSLGLQRSSYGTWLRPGRCLLHNTPLSQQHDPQWRRESGCWKARVAALRGARDASAGYRHGSTETTNLPGDRDGKDRQGHDTISSETKPDTPRTNVAGRTPLAANRTILDRLPQIHRPTKAELLAAATGFWSRQKVHFKWFSIRSVRPFNTDDISAFFSWFLVGHVIWILVGTTTFFSLAILTVNTVFAQGMCRHRRS